MTYDEAGRILTKTYPAATAENVTYTYDAVTLATNKGKGRLTRIASQSVTIDRVYDVRGNIVTDTRTISGLAHTTAYVYDAADQRHADHLPVGPHGQLSCATRRAASRRSRPSRTRPPRSSTLAIGHRPASRCPIFVQSLTDGNGLTDWATPSPPTTSSDLLQGAITAPRR